MSVASCTDGCIALIYKVIGTGTMAMREWQTGDTVSLLGPLGNGWEMPSKKLPILAGGGVGIAPINYLHEELERQGVKHLLIMGARQADEHFLSHAPDKNIILTTDDGSTGIKGTVVDGLTQLCEQSTYEDAVIYGCGPSAMLTALMSYTNERQLPCQLATEEIMACGIGLCQGCAVEVKTHMAISDRSYRKRIKLACLDGPVFWAHELV
ncbi:MAG: dihydroorotate dehydrogenase electron transfer subunit [Fidelibacterota bacterium]|nr:MAG: dihydroorotate dehydrogenase electron transfer subunit [Candidatus Neomarinimicrobiota bacterium]